MADFVVCYPCKSGYTCTLSTVLAATQLGYVANSVTFKSHAYVKVGTK